MWEGNGGVIAPPPHGDNTWDIPATDPGGRRRQRRDGDIRGVLSMGTDICVLNVRRMNSKGEQPRGTQRTLHVSALEVEVGNYTEGTRTNSAMLSLWDTDARRTSDETQTEGYM